MNNNLIICATDIICNKNYNLKIWIGTNGNVNYNPDLYKIINYSKNEFYKKDEIKDTILKCMINDKNELVKNKILVYTYKDINAHEISKSLKMKLKDYKEGIDLNILNNAINKIIIEMKLNNLKFDENENSNLNEDKNIDTISARNKLKINEFNNFDNNDNIKIDNIIDNLNKFNDNDNLKINNINFDNLNKFNDNDNLKINNINFDNLKIDNNLNKFDSIKSIIIKTKYEKYKFKAIDKKFINNIILSLSLKIKKIKINYINYSYSLKIKSINEINYIINIINR